MQQLNQISHLEHKIVTVVLISTSHPLFGLWYSPFNKFHIVIDMVKQSL